MYFLFKSIYEFSLNIVATYKSLTVFEPIKKENNHQVLMYVLDRPGVSCRK